MLKTLNIQQNPINAGKTVLNFPMRIILILTFLLLKLLYNILSLFYLVTHKKVKNYYIPKVIKIKIPKASKFHHFLTVFIFAR